MVNQLILIWLRYRARLSPSMITPTPMSQVPSGSTSPGTSQSPPIMMKNSPQPMASRRLFSARFSAASPLVGSVFCILILDLLSILFLSCTDTVGLLRLLGRRKQTVPLASYYR